MNNSNDDFCIVYSTFPNKEEATGIAKMLLADKLVACANIFSAHTAIYEWNDELCEENEVAVIFKTIASNIENVKSKIIENHSYDCPCIVSWSMDSHNDNYTKWLNSQIAI